MPFKSKNATISLNVRTSLSAWGSLEMLSMLLFVTVLESPTTIILLSSRVWSEFLRLPRKCIFSFVVFGGTEVTNVINRAVRFDFNHGNSL